jgi:asparagine synthetase B (glutamine-hydrolysing)
VISRYLSTPREEQFVSWNGWRADEIYELTGEKPDWRDNRLYSLYKSSISPKEHKTDTLTIIWEPETAYRKVVQLANLAGKNVRYPFLDRDLFAFSRNLPDRLKLSGRTNKVLLRRLLDKYLPKEIVNKKKGSFIFPKKYILASNDYEFIKIFLSPACIRKHGFVDIKPVTNVVDRYLRGDNSVEDRIWSLVLLQSWAELGVN